MDNDQKFWIAIWRTALAALLGIVTAFAGCTSYANHKITEMVKGGADPITAACSIRSTGQDAICVLSAQKSKP